MTTRRRFLATSGGLAGAVLLAGCERPGAAPATRAATRQAVPDVLLVGVAAGLATVHGTRVLTHGPAVAVPDGSTLYATAPAGDDTRLDSVDVRSGATVTRATLPGAWLPRVASTDGRRLALTPPDAAAPLYRPGGARRSPMLIVDRDGQQQRRRLDLTGNYQPDAFAQDGGALVVLDWLPPAAPDRYRVRMVDLATGAPGALLTRNKVPVPPGAEEEMRAQGREAVYSPDLQTLYTLYTHQPDHRHTRDLLAGRGPDPAPAFVHTLNLEIGWAYCLDLPAPFGRGPNAAHTIAVDRARSELLVADASSGRLAVADTETLTLRRVVTIPTGTGMASSLVLGNRLYLGIGTWVRAIDLDRLAPVAAWRVDGPVRGLAAGPDGARLYVGRPGGVAWLDPASGRRLGDARVAGLTGLRGAA